MMRGIETRARWVVSVLRDTVEAFMADRAPLLGAAVAFYAVLSLAPLLVLVVGFAGLAFGEQGARSRMIPWIHRAFDGAAADVVVRILENAAAPGAFTLPGLFSIVLALYYTSRLFNALRDALNQVWNVDERAAEGMRSAVREALRERLLGFGVMVAFGVLLLISLAVETALPVVAETVSELPGAWYLYRLLVLLVSTLVVGAAVAVVYRLLPSVYVKWRYVWGGALFTGFLLVVGKFLLGLYLGSGAVLTVPGAAGSVFALLLWIYYSAQVFFFGAEITQVVARRRGHGFGRAPPSLRKVPSNPPANDDTEAR